MPSYSKDEATGEIRVRPRQKLLERLPPTTGRSQALRDIHEKLAIATELYQAHGDLGRIGVFRAITDVCEYFFSVGIPWAALEPLSAVTAAIVDAESGTESPIFKPKRRKHGGAPKKSTRDLYFEGHLATVMECCVQHYRQAGARPYVEPAGVLAAKMVNDASWSRRVTATELREIRERVQQSAKQSPDRLFFDICRSSPLAKAMPLEWAKLLLRHEWVNPPPA